MLPPAVRNRLEALKYASRSKAVNILPCAKWIISYSIKDQLKSDLIAGITTGITVIPQGIAYATIAGLPPVYGLYTAIVPALMYFVFGTSSFVVVGPTAVMSLLIGSHFKDMAAQDHITHIFLISFLSGLINILLGLTKLGSIANMLSHPVISGFTSAASIIITVQQLPNLFGLSISGNQLFFLTVIDVFKNLSSTSIWSLVIGLCSIIIIIGLKKVPKLNIIPGPLVSVVVGTLIVWWQEIDIPIIGEIPSGLPPLSNIDFSYCSTFPKIILTSALVSCIGFIEGFSIGKTFAKIKGQELNPNSELIGIGMSNMIGSFFSCFPATGSFSRTAVNVRAGATSQMANLVGAILVIVAIQFMTSLFYYLPKSVLAAIIICAVVNLFDYQEIINLYRTKKMDLITLLVTLICTLLLGVEIGISVGFLTSIFGIILEISNPTKEIFFAFPNSQQLDPVDFLPSQSEFIARSPIIIIKWDDPLLFINLTSLTETIRMVRVHDVELGHPIKVIAIDFTNCKFMDSSGIHSLLEISEEVRRSGMQLHFIGIRHSIIKLLNKSGIIDNMETNVILDNASQVYSFTKLPSHVEGEKTPLLTRHK